MTNGHAPWRDEATLRQKYVVEGKTQAEIGEELGCSGNTISVWLDKFDIPKRGGGHYPEDACFKQREWLIEKYVVEGKSTHEMADEAGVDATTISRWMDKEGVEARYKHAKPKTNHNGYEVINHWVDGVYSHVRIHRLVALANGMITPSEFLDSSIDIHHENGVKWDNRPENLIALPHDEHLRMHSLERNRKGGDFD